MKKILVIIVAVIGLIAIAIYMDSSLASEVAALLQNNDFLIAIVGVCGALLGVFISGIIQFWINKKTISFYEKQLITQNEQFNAQLQLQKEQIDAKEKELEKKAQKEGRTTFYDKYFGKFDREYKDDIALRTTLKQIRNELAYIRHISAPERKEKRKTRQCYPHIDNKIGMIISDIGNTIGSDNDDTDSFDGGMQAFIDRVACLRSYIDEYNCALENGATIEELDEYLREINERLGSIQFNQELMSLLTEKRIEENEKYFAEARLKLTLGS